MQYFNKLEDIKINGYTVVTLGKFDGLHKGHQKLFKTIFETAEKKGLKTAVFTFDVSPQIKFGEKDNRVLFSNAEKRELMCESGFDCLVECPFTEEVRNMRAEDFVMDILIGKLRAKEIIIGTDCRFGRNRQGSAKYLLDNATSFGVNVRVIEKETDETGREISSTYIREELMEGNMKKVNELLGFDFFVSGEVVPGLQNGRKFGFPTINTVPDPQKMLPPNGVYASTVDINGKTYYSITNIGTKPTISGSEMGVETFIFDFNEDLYGQKVRVKLQEFERPERKFESIDALTTQVYKDIEHRRSLI